MGIKYSKSISIMVNKNINNLQDGMTLIELIVVVTIISIVSAVLMFSYSGFSGNANIRNLAQEIALGIRKSQIYATSVARTGSSTDPIYGAYGISFSARNSSNETDSTSKRFVLFADIPPTNKYYDSPSSVCGNGSECLETLTISSSDNIIKAEACTNSDCTSATGDNSVDIIFQRPSPDANICLHQDGGGCIGGPYSYAKITVKSIKGLTKVISVWNTGQISIQ
jgi:prepilin-type N-terminal cleavage/methylation domain-containing protein